MTVPTHTRTAYYPKANKGYQSLLFKDEPLRSLKASEVLVKINAVSLNYRDLLIPKGAYPADPVDNLVPCSDMAGQVVAVGEDVEEWKIGDRVSASFSLDHVHGDVSPRTRKSELGAAYTNGVLTRYRIFGPHSLVAIPEHFSYEEAATLPCAGVTAYNALTLASRIKAGDTVLTLGTGGVSMFTLQLAKASGATVIVTSSSDDKLALAKKLGADHTINYSKTPDWENEVLKITNGVGVDYAVDLGGPGTLERTLTATRHSGFVSVVGGLDWSEKGNGTLIGTMVTKNLNLRGVHVGSVQSFKAMNRLISSHPETTRPLIDKVFSFEDSVQAFAHLESQRHVGKVVIRID